LKSFLQDEQMNEERGDVRLTEAESCQEWEDDSGMQELEGLWSIGETGEVVDDFVADFASGEDESLLDGLVRGLGGESVLATRLDPDQEFLSFGEDLPVLCEAALDSADVASDIGEEAQPFAEDSWHSDGEPWSSDGELWSFGEETVDVSGQAEPESVSFAETFDLATDV
jgi:hypothetical protein